MHTLQHCSNKRFLHSKHGNIQVQVQLNKNHLRHVTAPSIYIAISTRPSTSMAPAKFWSILELKALVFSHLHDDECQKDLFSCALVHSTRTEPAIDALWQGYRRAGYRWGEYRENGKITEALLALPRSCRQKYASRISVLDFFQVEVDVPLLHTMF